jgi:hypothetical protein
VLPDTPAVRLLLVELANGGPLTTLDAVTVPALDALIGAGLVMAQDDDAVRRDRRARFAVHADAPPGVLPGLFRLLDDAGLPVARRPDQAALALVWSYGEPLRERLDAWMRADTPHLVVREGLSGPVLGPYVVPGRTACLRCVDARLAEQDPRRALVVEQLATTAPLRPAEADPTSRALAIAWVVRDLATAAEGRVPSTWSATVSLGALPATVTTYERHLHCGCAWSEELVQRAG